MKIITLLILFFLSLAWLLPNHYQPWLAAYQDFSAYIAAILVCIAYLAKNTNIKVPYFILFSLLIFLVPVVQYYLGVIYFFGDFVLNFLYLFSFFIMVIIGFNYGGDDKNRKVIYFYFSSLLIFVSVISVWICLRQWLLIGGNIWTVDMPPYGRPFANMAQPNQLATLLAMGCIATIYLYEEKYIGNFTSVFLLLFIVFGVALTQSRTPWVMCLFLAIWWCWKSRYFNPRLKLGYLLSFIFVYVIYILILPFIAEALGVNSISDVVTRATTGMNRLDLWRVALTALNNSTFWGFGWGQSSVAQMTISHIFPNPSREIMGYTHNLFLEILIWNGIWIGSLIIIVIVVCFLKLIYRARSLDSTIGLMFIGVVLIHAMLEYPLAYAYYLLPVGFILGLIYGELIPVNNFITLSNKFSAMFISFGVVLMILVWVDYRKVEVDHRLLRFELLRVGTLKAEEKSPDVFILTQLSEYIWAARTKPVAGMSDEDIERIRKVAYRYPDGFLVYKYIMVLYLNDRRALINNEIIKFNGLYNQNINIDDLMQEKIIIPRY